jgi:3-hydroxyisobutyrate dehydrogenase-like beta-hydroxyacid dehydrogenase
MTNTSPHDFFSPVTPTSIIGFLGIGNMGFAMLARLLEQGWPCASYDIDPMQNHKAQEAGARLVSAASDIGTLCRISFVVVVNSDQVREVLEGDQGLLKTAQAGDVIYLCPTLGPVEVGQFAERALLKGVHVVDSPMSGGPVRARQGEMSLMLAGPSPILAQHQPLLDAITRQRFTISETPSDAAKTKLANNLLAAINLAGISEVLAMAQAWGLNAQTTLDVMQASSGQSWIGQDRMQRALNNDFAPRAHTSLLAKDTRLALQTCEELKLSPPALGALATRQFEQACAQGFQNLDDASLFLQAGGKPFTNS